MEAERDVVQLRKVQFMQERIGETFAGFVSGVMSFGMFVELAQYFVEGLVHVATLTDDRYDLDEHRHRLVGRRTDRAFRVGDPVTVRIASRVGRTQADDLVLTEDERSAASSPTGRTRRSAGRPPVIGRREREIRVFLWSIARVFGRSVRVRAGRSLRAAPRQR